MLQRLSIRGKLLAVVAVPTIVLLLATAIVVWNAATNFSSARNVSQLVGVVERAAPLVENLEVERATVSRYLRTLTDGNNKFVTARTSTRTTVAGFVSASLEQPEYAPFAEAINSIAGSNDRADGLDAVRAHARAPTNTEGFPLWPEQDEVDAAVAVYEDVAAQVEEAVKGAPTGDLGVAMRALPDLIRTEADALATYLNEARIYSQALPDTFTSTDTAAGTFRNVAGSIDDSPTNELVLERALSAESGIDGLTSLRERIRTGASLPAAAETAYSAILADLLGMGREVANVVQDRDLGTYLNAYVSMQGLIEAMRIEELYVEREIRQGYWVLGEVAQFQEYYFGSNNALDLATQAMSVVPDAPPVPEFGASYDGRTLIGYESIRDRLFNDPTPQALLDHRSSEWSLQVQEEIDTYVPMLRDVEGKVAARAQTLERSSLIQTIVVVAAALIVVVASQLIAQAIARRIVNPLRRLTTTATAVRQELPRLVERVAMPGQTVDVSEVQIPVESADEVGRLAEAFNSVNAATLSIAAEQAALRGSISEMFVNVARRDQVLLNRQLASIDEMERTQDDPETLTKLFALDHLATRMRRNSESLLVLAGIDTGRRLRRPMPLSDVIRTASSEIELYERIQLELDADPAMLGHSALTAAHMFAELLENATVFSDPGSPVVVRTMERDGAVVVTVTDSGIGMTAEELAEANNRVTSTAASEILGAQRLGLFVVGRIARRVGARVHLDSVEGEGTVATVVMPPSLFDQSISSTTGHISTSVTDDAVHAPSALAMHREDEETRAEIPVPVDAYQPTIIEDAPLLVDRDVSDEAPLPARTPAYEAAPMSDEVSTLVAADAAAAPEGVEVQLAEYTEGVTPAGLPTRRRRRDSGPEAANDTDSIIGVQQRASDEQLSALASAATSGFTPILAADEVSPESAEQRARVFRGFRSTRAGDEATAIEPLDGESLGQTLRREAMGAAPGAYAPAPDPVLEPEPAREPDTAPQAAATPPPAASQPATAQPAPGTLDPASASPASSLADGIVPADPRDSRAHTGSQSPLISTGYTHAGTPEPQAVPAAPNPFDIPMLEEDETPPPAVALPPTPAVGVESVSLEEDPSPYSQPGAPDVVPQWRMDSTIQRPAVQPWAQRPEVPAAPPAAAPGPESPSRAPFINMPSALPANSAPPAAPTQPATPWPSAAPTPQPQAQPQAPLPAFAPDPVTSTPSLDDLIYDGSKASPDNDKGGFFGRLFGKGGKKPQTPSASERDVLPQPMQPTTPVSGAIPVSGALPSVPFSGPTPIIPISEPTPMAPGSGAIPRADVGPLSGPSPRVQPTRETARAPEQAVEQGEWGMFVPQTFEPPVDEALPLATGPVASAPTPRAPETPAPYAAAQGLNPEWGVGGDEWGPAEEYRKPADQMDHADGYSPDQLARPLGWEAAGASALQAAAPDRATEYRPLVQIDPEPTGDGDFASDAFSELSSLAMERPKVEKTRAGLVKRAPVERKPAEPEQPAAPSPHAAPRDAEAIRSRFSAFYSGTQRARTDAQTHNDTPGALTE